jgi:hypothetical protein
MRFAGQVGWRLPTEGEIYSLFDEDIQQVFYTRRSAKFRTYGPNGFVDTSLSTEYFFPSTYPLRVLGSSFSILDVKNGFKNIVTSYPVRLGVPFVEEIAGPKYFCVKTTSP